MMLRGSAMTAGTKAELGAIVDTTVDSGVEHGAEILNFVDAVLTKPGDLAAARNALAAAAGGEFVADVAGVIGNFMRMVRIADGTGIPIDERMVELSADVRDSLGLNEFQSARLPAVSH